MSPALFTLAFVAYSCIGISVGDIQDYRLPQAIQPTYYKLHVRTGFKEENFTYYGKVWVDVVVKETTNNITLHSKDLNILQGSTVLLLLDPGNNISSSPDATSPPVSQTATPDNQTRSTSANPDEDTSSDTLPKGPSNSVPSIEGEESADISIGSEVKILNSTVDKYRDFLILHMEKPLKRGAKYRLHLEYEGRLSDTLTGYYKGSYTEDNKTRWMASTVFEPIGARTAFPCFDEPGFKAPFLISLGRPGHMMSLSNSALNYTSPEDGTSGRQWDHYEVTPAMPTYLAAFFVGELGYREADQRHSGKPFRVWARREMLPQTEYALEVGPRMLSFLAGYLDVEEPLPKQDLLALPVFVSDALENWGLISFGERYILHQPDVSSVSNKLLVTQVVAHELAHSWFGNMASLRWWSDIWLNEGFATYFSTLAVDHVQPGEDTHSIHALKAFLRIFSVDALHSSHALTVNTDKPTDLFQIFDSIAYEKGYYLLRMLNHTLGEESFRKACTRYLRSNWFGSVTQDDLWRALNDQGHEDGVLPPNIDLKSVMESWTRQVGYPVITVTRDYANNTASLTQTRFLRPKEDLEARSDGNQTAWWIPVTYTSETEADFTWTGPRLWLDPGEEITTLGHLPGPANWVLFNNHVTGLYRINYDHDNWQLLSDALNDADRFSDVAVLNRAQLLDDSLDFARAGQLPYPVALNITAYLVHETHYLPWKAALSNLGYINRMIRSTDSGPGFQRFIWRLVAPQFERLGFDSRPNEPLVEKLNRQQILRWACRTGHEPCVQKTLQLFSSWMAEPSPDSVNPIAANLRSVVYCTAIEHSGQKQWDFLWQRYIETRVGSEKKTIISGLGCSKDPGILNRYLAWSTQASSGVKKEDSAAVFKAVAKSSAGHSLAAEFLKLNIDRIQKYIGDDLFHLPQLLEALAAGMNQPEQLQELEGFQREHEGNLRTASRSVKQANEQVKFNIGWLQNYYAQIRAWIKSQEPKTI